MTDAETQTMIVNIMVNAVYYGLMLIAVTNNGKTKCRERDCTICEGIPHV